MSRSQWRYKVIKYGPAKNNMNDLVAGGSLNQSSMKKQLRASRQRPADSKWHPDAKTANEYGRQPDDKSTTEPGRQPDAKIANEPGRQPESKSAINLGRQPHPPG